MKAPLRILILSGILSASSLAQTQHELVCEAKNEDCYAKCARKHPKSEYNREKCHGKCERRLTTCLESPAPSPAIIEREPPVVVERYPYGEPYPYDGPYPYWGGPYGGWRHHHRHWRHW